MKPIIWFHRLRSALWFTVGILSFPLGWANSVALVWIASVYANVVSDWGASEAADDREILDSINALAEQGAQHHAALLAAINRLTEVLLSTDKSKAAQNRAGAKAEDEEGNENENLDQSRVEKTSLTRDYREERGLTTEPAVAEPPNQAQQQQR